MTPPKPSNSTKTIAHSKRSPPAAWKESLRRACLDRARQRWTNRSQLHEREQYSAEQIITWELQQKGASIRRDHREYLGNYDWQQWCDENLCMTETEWIDLLEQVELEMEMDRARTEQGISDQDMYLEHQVANYEEWQQAKLDDDAESITPCPVCGDGRLARTATNDIVCPNHMDGSCSMRLLNTQGTLQKLRETLQQVIEHHAICPGPLSFHVDAEGSSLIAECSLCRGSQRLIL